MAKTGAGDESYMVFPQVYLAGRIKLERQEVGSRLSLVKLKFHCWILVKEMARRHVWGSGLAIVS